MLRVNNLSLIWPFKRQPPKMVKHTQTIRRQQLMYCLSVFGHFVKLALKGLICNFNNNRNNYQGTIYLVRTQDFPKNQHSLPPDTQTYGCVSGGKFSFLENFYYVLNGW